MSEPRSVELVDLCKIIVGNDRERFRLVVQEKNWSKNVELNDYIDPRELNLKQSPGQVQRVVAKTTCLCLASEYSSAFILKALLGEGARCVLVDSMSDTPLHKACKSNIDAREKVRILVKQDPFQLTRRNDKGTTPLHYAAVHIDNTICEYLVSFENLDVNIRTHRNATPLHYAVFYAREKNAQALLRHVGIDINVQNDDGDTALHLAARSNQTNLSEVLKKQAQCVRSLLNRKGFIADQEDHKNIMLLVCSEKGSAAEVTRLISAGALCVKDYVGEVPLHKACRSAKEPLNKVKCLLKHDISQIHVRSRQGLLPLHLAARNPYSRVLSCFLDLEDIDVNAETAEKKSTALHISCHLGLISNIDALLSHCAIEINALDSSRNTPLHLAAEKGNKRIIGTLQSQPMCQISLINADGFKAEQLVPANIELHKQSKNGRKEDVERVLQQEPDCIIDREGNSPLHLACLSDLDSLEKAQMLIKYDRRLLALSNREGSLPIHVAVQQNKRELVKYFGEKYEINARSKTSQTPLHIAALYGHSELIYELRNNFKNIEVNLQDVEGNTPGHIASMNNKQGAFTAIQTFSAYKPGVLNKSGKTAEEGNPMNSALRRFVEHSDAETVIQVLQEGAQCLTDDDGNTLLHKACVSSMESLEKCKALQNHDPSMIKTVNRHKETVLHQACCNEGASADLIEYLLKNEVDLNARDNKGQTALFLAVKNKQIDIMNVLLKESNIDVNQGNDRKETPLHMAVYNDDLAVTEALLAHKETSVNVQELFGDTAWHTAYSKKNYKIMKCLENHPEFNPHVQNNKREMIRELIKSMVLLRNYTGKALQATKMYKFEERPYRVSGINDNLWAVRDDFDVDILQCNGGINVTRIRKITIHEVMSTSEGIDIVEYNARRVIQTTNGMLIAACFDVKEKHQEKAHKSIGLVVINNNGEINDIIAEGGYRDVKSDTQYVYGLPRPGFRVTIHQYQNHGWVFIREVKLEEKYQRLCIYHNILILSHANPDKMSRINMDKMEITHHYEAGKQEGQFTWPYVSLSDREGHVLVCDHMNDRVQVLLPDNTYRLLRIDGDLEYPGDATLDSHGHLYVLSYRNKTLYKISNDK